MSAGRFGIDALPYGSFRRPGGPWRGGARIADAVIDLVDAAAQFAAPLAPLFDQPSLNAFLAAGPQVWADVRGGLQEWMATADRPSLPLGEVELRLPFDVADYVDFYSSRHHAERLGQILRPGQPPLTDNWLHLPVGYHGRAGTVVVSDTPIVRPSGQRRRAPGGPPTFGPSQCLDIEAELGFVVGVPSTLGVPVPVDDFADHVFGVVVVNDWSARDIQAWEYQPLGPFLGKSFATSISAWVLPLAALERARVPTPPAEVEQLPYLRAAQPWGLDIELDVELNGTVLAHPPFATMYWSAAQQMAHLTVNGAALRTGDLFASGTISGPRRDQSGSLIELTWDGSEPLVLADGSSRGFLQDGDTVTIRAGALGGSVGLGEVSGTVLPTR